MKAKAYVLRSGGTHRELNQKGKWVVYEPNDGQIKIVKNKWEEIPEPIRHKWEEVKLPPAFEDEELEDDENKDDENEEITTKDDDENKTIKEETSFKRQKT